MIYLLFVALLTTSSANDVIQKNVVAPPENGVIVLRWTPAPTPSNPQKPLLIFNHFLNSYELALRVHYDTYSSPVLEFRLGPGNLTVRSQALMPFQRGQTYNIVVAWVKGAMTEVAIVVNDVVVGQGIGTVNRSAWSQSAFVGGRNFVPVSDPTFPGVQHADGKIENLVVAKL